MKTWTKVAIGLGVVGAAIGGAVAFIGKNHKDDAEDYVEVEETETNDSEVEDEE